MSTKVFHTDEDMISSSKELRELTDKFLRDFLEVAKKTQKNYSTDSFELHYSLPECLINSDLIRNEPEIPMHPLLDMGLCQNLVIGLFERNVHNIKFGETLNCILDNFNKQEKYGDYTASDMETVTKEIIDDEINIDRLLKKDSSLPLILKVPKTKKSVIFALNNSKSGYSGKCEVIYIDERIKEIFVYSKENEKVLSMRVRRDGKTFEPTVHHFKYVAEINSFFHVMEQIVYGIEETINGQNIENE